MNSNVLAAVILAIGLAVGAWIATAGESTKQTVQKYSLQITQNGRIYIFDAERGLLWNCNFDNDPDNTCKISGAPNMVKGGLNLYREK